MPPNFQAARTIPFQRAIFHFMIFWNYGFWEEWKAQEEFVPLSLELNEIR
jgi:hypothetical protein